MNSLVQILVSVLNSLWQAVIVVALVWLALKLARRMKLAMNAATRYAIWWAVLGIVVVLPAASRLRWSRIQPATGDSAPARAVTRPVLPAAEDAPVIITLREERSARWPIWMFGIWSAVFLYRMAEIARSYFYLRGVKRRAAASSLPLPENKRPASLLLSHEVVSPMAVGFLRPAVILPASLQDEITEQELQYVLLHEYAHLARRDDWWNLIAHLMGAALALHPAAWWILRQIEHEREMACDDWVVARTGAARPYAQSLARLSELRWSRRKQLQGEALAAGIFGGGSRLGERIEVLLARGARNRARSRLLAGSFLTALIAITVAFSSAPRWIAFAQQPAFEVASIKQTDPNDERESILSGPGGRFTTKGVTLKELISEAYDLRDHQISGGPGWIASARFDIDARPGSAIEIAPGPAGFSQIRPMIQSLLEERFRLAVHRETRQEPVYELVVAQGGRKLKEVPDAANDGQSGLHTERGRIVGTAARVPMLVRVLAGRLGRSVIDKTGLTGKYDFTLEYTADLGPPSSGQDAAPPPDSSGPSLFTALQEQLGLKLESAKGPVEVLVIDHAEKPDAN